MEKNTTVMYHVTSIRATSNCIYVHGHVRLLLGFFLKGEAALLLFVTLFVVMALKTPNPQSEWAVGFQGASQPLQHLVFRLLLSFLSSWLRLPVQQLCVHSLQVQGSACHSSCRGAGGWLAGSGVLAGSWLQVAARDQEAASPKQQWQPEPPPPVMLRGIYTPCPHPAPERAQSPNLAAGTAPGQPTATYLAGPASCIQWIQFSGKSRG